MRRFLPVLVVSLGTLFFVSCSKKSDTAPGAESAAPATTSTVPETPPASDDTEVSFSLSRGKDSGVTNPGTTTPAAGATDGLNQEPPRVVSRVIPFYPLSLRLQGIEGRVDVEILINTSGIVEQADVVLATEPRFSEYAVAALRQARFIPAKENGVPIPARTLIPVPFTSERASREMPANSPLARLQYVDGTYYTRNETGRLVPAEITEPTPLLQLEFPLPNSVPEGETVTARAKVTVTAEGQATNVSVSRSSNADFTKSIQETLPFWQFIPRIKAGKAMAITVEIPFTAKASAARQ